MSSNQNPGVVICPACGQQVNGNYRFCTSCGCKIEPPASQPIAEQPPVAAPVPPVAEPIAEQPPVSAPVFPVAEPIAEQPPVAAPVSPVAEPIAEQPPVAAPVPPVAQPAAEQPPVEGKGKSGKSRKPLIISIIAVIAVALIVGSIFGIPAIIKVSNYNSAKKLLDSGKYVEAIAAFKDLDGYSDSKKMISEAMYRYVGDNKEKEDENTQKYLKALKDANYKDSAEIYDELFGWHISFSYLNTDENDTETIDKVVSKYCTYLHYDFIVTGGMPDEEIDISMETVYPDGTSETDTFDNKFKDGDTDGFYYGNGLYDFCESGTIKLIFTNVDTGEKIETLKIKVSDEYIWKAAVTYFNTNENDTQTFETSVSKYVPYYHIGYKVWGGPSSGSINIRYVKTYPDGTTDENTFSQRTNGSNHGVYGDSGIVKQPDVMTSGKMKLEFFNADTDELLASYEFKLNDDKVADQAFKGKVELKYCNYDANDITTTLPSIAIKGDYLQVGYNAVSDDGNSTGTVKMKIVKVLPSGEVESSAFDYKLGGTYYSYWSNGYDFEQPGKLIFKFYDLASGTLLSEFAINVS